MAEATYRQRRGEIETYFDRTAVDAWAKLTSTAPVGRIRASVRAGRDRMRETLLSWLPQDLEGKRVLDAGCGTGALAILAAKRGADVVAIDLSPTLIDLARARAPAKSELGAGSVVFMAGDMLDPELGKFDHVVGMDSLIHYDAADAVRVLSCLAARTRISIAFTFAPKTPLLAVMHGIGRLFPRSDRAPSIVPVSAQHLSRLLGNDEVLQSWTQMRVEHVSSGFYKSRALELVRR
jgi:magnesium-protoporphyrin O-methyltransferase